MSTDQITSIIWFVVAIGAILFLSLLVRKIAVQPRNFLIVLGACIIIAVGVICFVSPSLSHPSSAVAASIPVVTSAPSSTVAHAHSHIKSLTPSQPKKVVVATSSVPSNNSQGLWLALAGVVAGLVVVVVLKFRGSKFLSGAISVGETLPVCPDCGRNAKINAYRYASGKYKVVKRVCFNCAKKLGATLISASH